MRGLVEMGFGLGIVLNPGMPGFRPEDCIEDAASLVRSGAPPVDFVRLNWLSLGQSQRQPNG